jgi:hypothetical protein
MTTSGLETATFRLVAWCLNHYATAYPQNLHNTFLYLTPQKYSYFINSIDYVYFTTAIYRISTFREQHIRYKEDLCI